jgi:hypothetical protein
MTGLHFVASATTALSAAAIWVSLLFVPLAAYANWHPFDEPSRLHSGHEVLFVNAAAGVGAKAF